MSSIVIVCIITILVLLVVQAVDFGPGFIAICDEDNSGAVSAKELSKCFTKMAIEDPSAESVMVLADADGDGELTSEEYSRLMDVGRNEKDEGNFATFKSRDGTVRNLSRKDFESLVRQSENMQARMSGKDIPGIPEEKEKRRSLEDIAKEDPELAKFIAIVRWAVDELRDRGNPIHGELLQLRSLPPGGSNNRDSTNGNVAVDWGGVEHADIWFEFSTSPPSKHLPRELFEVYVERNAAIYRRPYLAIKGAWTLDDETSRRKSELSLPRPRMCRKPEPPGKVCTDEGEMKLLALLPVIGLTMLAIFSVRGFVTEWFEVREAKRRLALAKKDD